MALLAWPGRRLTWNQESPEFFKRWWDETPTPDAKGWKLMRKFNNAHYGRMCAVEGPDGIERHITIEQLHYHFD